MSPLKSGDLAQQAKVNPETLRYYEREGLLRNRYAPNPAIGCMPMRMSSAFG